MFKCWPGSLGVVFVCLQACVAIVYVEIVRHCFLSYPFQYINDSKSAIHCNITDATEMTQVSVTTIDSALFDQKIYRGYLHTEFLALLFSAFFISKNTTCIGML